MAIKLSLSDVSHSMGVRTHSMKQSFERFLEVVPEAVDHVELVEEVTRGGFGVRCLTYRVDTVALCAYLYWREHRGRFPRFLGVKRRLIEGGEHHGR